MELGIECSTTWSRFTKEIATTEHQEYKQNSCRNHNSNNRNWREIAVKIITVEVATEIKPTHCTNHSKSSKNWTGITSRIWAAAAAQIRAQIAAANFCVNLDKQCAWKNGKTSGRRRGGQELDQAPAVVATTSYRGQPICSSSYICLWKPWPLGRLGGEQVRDSHSLLMVEKGLEQGARPAKDRVRAGQQVGEKGQGHWTIHPGQWTMPTYGLISFFKMELKKPSVCSFSCEYVGVFHSKVRWSTTVARLPGLTKWFGSYYTSQLFGLTQKYEPLHKRNSNMYEVFDQCPQFLYIDMGLCFYMN